jgi:hypothetical protein
MNCLSAEAGAEYNELKYLNEITLNSFNGGHDKRYGVRPGATPRNDEAEVNKSLTYTQTFQIVLTKGCTLTGVSDTERYEAFLDLHEIALKFQKRVINTKAGLPSRVINAINFTIDEPEFLDDKVAVLTGNIDIIYRISL